MESWKDPFVTYRYIKDVRAPWRPNQGKAVWRNLNDLVDVKGRRAPAVLRQYFDLEKDSEDASIALYGVQTDRASFLGTFQYDLKIPARLTRDDSALRFLTLVIRAAENMEKVVRESLADVPGISSALISSASRIFYDRCESKFWAVCANLGNSVEALKAQYLAWCDDLTGVTNSVRIRILREAQLSGHSLAKAASSRKRYPVCNREKQERDGIMEQKAMIETFFTKLKSLSTGQRTVLKRCAGIMLTGADARALAVFYRILPPGVPQWQEPQWFAAACFACLWDTTEAEGRNVEQLLSDLIRMDVLSGSMQHRIEILLDTTWESDGYLLTKLSRMLKMLRQKTAEVPNFAALLTDLLYWNNESQSVQRKWAHAVFGGTE